MATKLDQKFFEVLRPSKAYEFYAWFVMFIPIYLGVFFGQEEHIDTMIFYIADLGNIQLLRELAITPMNQVLLPLIMAFGVVIVELDVLFSGFRKSTIFFSAFSVGVTVGFLGIVFLIPWLSDFVHAVAYGLSGIAIFGYFIAIKLYERNIQTIDRR